MTRAVWRRIACGAALVLAGGAVAGAQSLADVARQEQSRRKQAPAPTKVYTNQDLARVDAPAATPAAATPAAEAAAPQAAAPEGAAAAAPPSRPATDARPEPEKGEKYWRERVGTARGDLERSKTFAEALQARIGALTQDFVNRDDPGQRAVVEQNRQKAVAELERVQREIAAQTKAIAGIEDEARKAGVPAGWLR